MSTNIHQIVRKKQGCTKSPPCFLSLLVLVESGKEEKEFIVVFKLLCLLSSNIVNNINIRILLYVDKYINKYTNEFIDIL